jgi:cytochrome c oxidase subunit 2
MMKFKGLLPACALLLSGAANAQRVDMPGGPAVNQLNLTTGVTQIASDIAWLHWMMLIICLVIFIGVFGVMFYSIWAHRKSKGAKPATFHDNVKVEIAWTIIPFLIVIGMALPATRTVVAMKDTSGADMTVKVTGYQWKWGYEYLDGPAEGINFLSNLSTPQAQINNLEPKGEFYLMEVDNPLVVPVGQKVRVVVTAADVIHSWMVPDFGVKQDAIPGFLRDTWFRAEQVGTYRGQCAELCGKDHAFMPIVVEVLSQEDYVAWAQQQQAALVTTADDPNREWEVDELVARGQSVYNAQCIACHQATGQGLGPAFPALVNSPIVMGPMADNIEIMLNGRPGTAMQSYANLSDVEIASVITYTRQSWDNAGRGSDPVVQPIEVRQAR